MQWRRRFTVMIVAGLTVCLAASCSTDSTKTPTATPRESNIVATSTSPSTALGRWTSSVFKGAFVDIIEGGTFSGNDGCNTIGGSWVSSADGKSLELTGVFQTLMACEGLTSWSVSPAIFAQEGDTLVVGGTDGTTLDTLRR